MNQKEKLFNHIKKRDIGRKIVIRKGSKMTFVIEDIEMKSGGLWIYLTPTEADIQPKASALEYRDVLMRYYGFKGVTYIRTDIQKRPLDEAYDRKETILKAIRKRYTGTIIDIDGSSRSFMMMEFKWGINHRYFNSPREGLYVYCTELFTIDGISQEKLYNEMKTYFGIKHIYLTPSRVKFDSGVID